MARATLDDPVGPSPITYSWRWEAPGKRLAAQFDLGVVDGIVAESLRGLGSLPNRGVDVGGILIGSVEPGVPSTVVIRRFEPVPIEYLHGPQYRLSERDLKSFSAAAERLRLQPADLRPVGFYRSNADETFRLTADDNKLLAELFPNPQHVVLLIHPALLKAPSAVLMVRENGVFPDARPGDVFPFRRRELTRGLSERLQGEWNRLPLQKDRPIATAAESPTPAAKAAEPVSFDLASEPIKIEPEPPVRSRLRLAIAVLLLTLLALGATAGDWYARQHAASVSAATLLAPDPYAIGLSAEGREDHVLLQWNRNARVLGSGEHGLLTVTENDKSKTIDLDPAQLRSGMVLYRHIAPEIRFRLEVFTAENRAVVETLVWHPKGS